MMMKSTTDCLVFACYGDDDTHKRNCR